jgi:mannitol/fructose-specific phosphotransferase system IIA component (Ntr-type)
MRSILTALQDGRLFELPEGASKERVLGFLARILDANPNIEAGIEVIEEITLREKECNTGIGLGVAVPHVRARREEGDLFCAIGWSSQGVAYDAPDGSAVHLVVLYYIPGSQKNVYLKEVSTLVKAIRKSGGIEPIAKAPDLNAVRNLLLDWVSSVLGDAGPESVARMIKLEVKQAQAPEAAPVHPAPQAPVAPAVPAAAHAIDGQVVGHVAIFSVLVAPPLGPVVLSSDAELAAALEKESCLVARLATGAPFTLARKRVFVTGSAAYSGARVLYQCVGIPDSTPSSDLSKT